MTTDSEGTTPEVPGRGDVPWSGSKWVIPGEYDQPYEGEPERVLLVGDTHGDLAWWRHLIQLADEHQCQGIFQLGDFGIWPGAEGRRYLDAVESSLDAAGLTGWFVDGNHDDFDQLLALPVGPDGWRPVRPHLFHAPRGHRWSWQGVRFLAMGGAGSVDVAKRIPGRTWWPQEAITDEDVSRVVAGGPVRVMLTHDAPTRARPVPLGETHWELEGVLPEVLDYCAASQARLQSVVDATKPELLVHGHWHLFRDDRLKHGPGNWYRVIGLNCNGATQTAVVLTLPYCFVEEVD